MKAEKLVEFNGLKIQSVRKTCKSSRANNAYNKDENADDDDDSEDSASIQSFSMTMVILGVTALLSLIWKYN